MDNKNEQTGLTFRFLSDKFRRYMVTIIVSVIIFAVYLLLNTLTRGRFLTVDNMLIVLTNSIMPILNVLCLVFIFTMGIFDLSAGAIIILASNVGGILALQLGLGYPGLFVGSIATAIVLLMLNIKVMIVTKIPPWIFGLGATLVYEGIGAFYGSYMLSKGQQAVTLGRQYRELGVPPWSVIIAVLALVIAYIIYNKTSIGFALRSVGSNMAVAEMMGINIPKTIMLAGIIGGVFLGLASAVNSSFSGRVMPVTGLSSIGVVFSALPVYLLASSFQRAFNFIWATAICAFLVTSLFNVLTLLHVPSGTLQQVVMGASVIICGIISNRKFSGVVK